MTGMSASPIESSLYVVEYLFFWSVKGSCCFIKEKQFKLYCNITIFRSFMQPEIGGYLSFGNADGSDSCIIA